MKKAIVTTTINNPTDAIIAYAAIAARDDWHFFIVGDQNTPHKAYYKIPGEYEQHVSYLAPGWQETNYPRLSKLIGWNCIQRRNFGFIEAYKWGADIIATVDDDNIPLNTWGQQLIVNQEQEVNAWTPKQAVFDPLSVTNYFHLWHRGFPVTLLPDKNVITQQTTKLNRVLVQADLWNGKPDIDAICRIAYNDPVCNFNVRSFFTSDKIAPFNSQNTFLHRDVFPQYFLYPGIGRMDDIFAAYQLQHSFSSLQGRVVFGPASVYQERNKHDFVKDLEKEMIGYNYALDVATDPDALMQLLPRQSTEAFREYCNIFEYLK